MRPIYLIVHRAAGTDLPMQFAESYDQLRQDPDDLYAPGWTGADDRDIDSLLRGYEYPRYADAWDRVYRRAYYTHGSQIWILQFDLDGDLLAIDPYAMDNEDYQTIFHTDRPLDLPATWTPVTS